MKIQILGPGCKKCKTLAENAEQAVRALGVDATVEKVSELREIMQFKVMSTPAIAIDGQVKSAGRVLTPEEIQALLRPAAGG